MERLHFEQDGHNFISSESGYDTTGDPANTPLHSPHKAFLLRTPRTTRERPVAAPISEGDQTSPSDAEVTVLSPTSASRSEDDESKLGEEGELYSCVTSHACALLMEFICSSSSYELLTVVTGYHVA